MANKIDVWLNGDVFTYEAMMFSLEDIKKLPILGLCRDARRILYDELLFRAAPRPKRKRFFGAPKPYIPYTLGTMNLSYINSGPDYCTFSQSEFTMMRIERWSCDEFLVGRSRAEIKEIRMVSVDLGFATTVLHHLEPLNEEEICI